MSACVLWLDLSQAKLFKITTAGVEKKSLHRKDHATKGAHHDQHDHNSEEHFYHEVALSVGKVEEILVFGPGVAKTHFKTHLEKHNHNDLVKHLVGVEPLDNLTDNQILEAGRKFFKKYNTYNSVI